MKTPEALPHDGHLLIQIGIFLFLLALLAGLAVPRFAVPRLALSAHLLGIMQGIFLMVTGLLWPKLRFTRSLSRIGYALAIYGCFAAWTANVCGAAWGAGASMVPMAAGSLVSSRVWIVVGLLVVMSSMHQAFAARSRVSPWPDFMHPFPVSVVTAARKTPLPA